MISCAGNKLKSNNKQTTNKQLQAQKEASKEKINRSRKNCTYLEAA